MPPAITSENSGPCRFPMPQCTEGETQRPPPPPPQYRGQEEHRALPSTSLNAGYRRHNPYALPTCCYPPPSRSRSAHQNDVSVPTHPNNSLSGNQQHHMSLSPNGVVASPARQSHSGVVADDSNYCQDTLASLGMARRPVSYYEEIGSSVIASRAGERGCRRFSQKIAVHNLPDKWPEDRICHFLTGAFSAVAGCDGPRFVMRVQSYDAAQKVAEVEFSWASCATADTQPKTTAQGFLSQLKQAWKDTHRFVLDRGDCVWASSEDGRQTSEHRKAFDAYLQGQAALREGETRDDRARRFAWLPLSSVKLDSYYPGNPKGHRG